MAHVQVINKLSPKYEGKCMGNAGNSAVMNLTLYKDGAATG